MARFLCLSLLYYVLFGQTRAFSPYSLTGSNAFSKTHKDITNVGIKDGLFKYLTSLNLTSSSNFIHAFDDYFEDDRDGKEEFETRIDGIIDKVGSLETSTESHIHCNSEQFHIAHAHILRLREQMNDLADSSSPNLALIREMIGECLYTIQAFYSTSNWVEMNGKTAYNDFGTPNRVLMAIADLNEDTCRDCDNSGTDESSCKGNLLITDKLTSGYQTGQDVKPPYKTNTDLTTGKCGFGGSSDTENGKQTALGGINKDRLDSTFSPHHHLHYDAYFAAKLATEKFLTDQDSGIINELQKDLFLDVFNLKKRYSASFGFVIDVTGSMGNNIAGVKQACVDIIMNVLGTSNEPDDYVLSTFSDPESLTQLVSKTTDGLGMISTIDGLTVTGGGDCPEFAMSGLLKCIEECKDNSYIFIFTDAPAKDYADGNLVVTKATEKNIKIISVTQHDMCSWDGKRKKRSLGRSKRSTGTDVYWSIAEATGGKVYEFNSGEIADMLREITEELFPSSTAVIDFFSLSITYMYDYVFSIDNSASNFKITLLGPSSSAEVDLLYDSGSIMSSTKTNVLFESPAKVVITVVSPTPGQYTLQRLVSRYWDVNITTQSAVDFNFRVLEEKSSGSMSKVSGNPILGRTYAVFTTIYNLPENASIDEMILTSSDGVESHFNMTQVPSDYDVTYFIATELTSESYKVSIYGKDDNGTDWKRTSPYLINPVGVELSLLDSPDLYVGGRGNITYNVTNKGTANETFVVTITDNRGLLVGETTLTATLGRDISDDVTFQIEGSSSFKTVTYTVSVRKWSESRLLQEHSKTLYINPNVPPTCSINTINGYCGDLTIANVSCSSVTWSGTATVTFTSGLSSLTGTSGLRIDTKNNATSSLDVDVSGDCCSPSAYLTAMDHKNNFVRCHFYLGEVVTTPVEKPALSTEEKIAIGVVAGIVVAVCAALVVFALITYRAGIKPKLDALKIDSLNRKAAETFPEKSDKSYKAKYQYPIFNHAPSDTKMHVGGLKLNDLQITEFEDFN